MQNKHKMNIQQLRNILILSQKLNFTRAAEQTNIVQPAFSRQIKQLEEEVGVQLFDRNKRNVKVTPSGDYFISEIEKILKTLEKAIAKTRKIDKGEAGEIRIGFTHSALQTSLPNILKSIKQHFPDLKIILKEINNHDHYLSLLHGDLDLGIGTNPIVPSYLNHKTLHIDYFAVILPDNHPVNKTNYIDFSVFSDEHLIRPSRTSGANHVRIIESICSDAGFTPGVVHETDSAIASLKLVEAGMGIALEPISSLIGLHFKVKSIVLDTIDHKVEHIMMWHPDKEKEYPALFEILKKN
jgi:DNA-binding transcriptional LysR family regulator